MASIEEMKKNIPLLVGSSNFDVWKRSLRFVLYSESLEGHLERGQPATDATAAQKIMFEKEERKIKSLIVFSVLTDYQSLIMDLPTAKEMFQTLRSLFEKNTWSHYFSVRRRLYNLTYNEETDFNLHLLELNSCVSQLASCSNPVSEHERLTVLLMSLPKSYSEVVSRLMQRDNLTYENAVNHIKEEYEFRCNVNSADTLQEQTCMKLSTTGKGQNVSQHKDKRGSLPFHPEARRQNKGPYQRENRGRGSTIKCYKCQRQGHKASECVEQSRNTNNFFLSTNKDSGSNHNVLYASVQDKTHHVVIDSGSSLHLFGSEFYFVEKQSVEPIRVNFGNSSHILCHEKGTVLLKSLVSNGKVEETYVSDVYYSSQFKTNVLSMALLDKKNCHIKIYKGTCKVFHHSKEVLVAQRSEDNVYTVTQSENSIINKQVNTVRTSGEPACICVWHNRLAHRSKESILDMHKKGLLRNIEITECVGCPNECESCIITKTVNAPFPKLAERRSERPLQLIHSDVCGPIYPLTMSNYKYFVSFIDDYSRFTHVYLIREKSEVFQKLKEYCAMVNNKFGKYPEVLRSDNGGEYCGHDVQKYLKDLGIIHQTTVPYSPQQNGVAERMNKTLVEAVRAMLYKADLTKKLWGEALVTATYTTNRVVTKATNNTPFECWHGYKPSVDHLRTFGCEAYAYIPKQKRKSKLDDRAVKLIFIGYSLRTKGYKLWDPITGKITISRTVQFCENLREPASKGGVHSFVDREIKDQGHQMKEEDVASFPQEGEEGTSKDIMGEQTELTKTVQDLQELPNMSTDEPEDMCSEDDKQLDIFEETQQMPQSPVQEVRRSGRSNKGVPPDRLTYLARTSKRHRELSPKRNFMFHLSLDT